MAQISGMSLIRHLRAEPNQFILHYKNGKLTHKGPGLAYWFISLRAAVAQVPIEDCETTFVLKDRSEDFQELAVQLTVTYRIQDAEKAASRINFSVSLVSGEWMEQPLERLASVLSQRAVQPTRSYLAGVPVFDAVQKGAEAVRAAVADALATDDELEAMGLKVVNLQVVRVAPSAELDKALQTPTREGIQQKADEAVFARRALAVEKERAIKENELSTEIELARRQEELIRQQGQNRLLEINKDAEAEKARIQAEIERSGLAAEAAARETEVKAEGRARAERLLAEATAEGEARRVAVWRDAPGRVAIGLAMQEFAGKVNNIQHLSLTPDVFAKGFEQLLQAQAEQ